MSTDSAVLSQARYLQGIQNEDGEWGLDTGYPSSPTNTAEVLTGLQAATADVTAEVEQKATEFLERNQIPEGGWGSRSQRGQASIGRTASTAWAIRALSKCTPSDEIAASLDVAWDYLLEQQESYGEWIECGNKVPSVTATCRALRALVAARWPDKRQERTEAINRGLTWLSVIQREGRIGLPFLIAAIAR